MWLSVDPLAHKMPAMSPYVFTANNPILFHDPTGLIPVVPEPPNENDPEPPLSSGMIPTENHPSYGIYWPQGSGRVSESSVSLASKGLPSLGGSSETSVNGSMAAGQGVNPGLALANAINSMPLVMLGPVPMINPLFGAGAVAIDGGANLVGAEGDLGIILMLRGKDCGKYITYKEIAGGGGTGGCISGEITQFDFTGGNNNLRLSYLEGYRDKAYAGVNVYGFFGIGIAGSWSQPRKNNWIFGTTISFGFGLSPFLIDAGYNQGNVEFK
jgi:hypothetical protein